LDKEKDYEPMVNI